MASDDDFDIEAAMKDQLDLVTFRDKVVGLIWRDDRDGLRLCREQVMLPFILEKVIAEIASGNDWNDVLCLIARRLIEAEPAMEYQRGQLEEKMQLVGNPTGGGEILKPFVREELSPNDFMKKVDLIAGTHTFMGLDALVAENPNTTRNFVRHLIAKHGGTMDPDTRMFQLLCEMAMAYRNHRHEPELLELLQRAGGRIHLLKTAEDIGSVQIIEGADALHELHDEARRARKVMHTGDLDTALGLFETVLTKMETVFAGMNPIGDWEYINSLLFSAVLLAIKGEAGIAQQRLLTCMKRRFLFGLHAYGALLLTNVEPLRQNAIAIREALAKVPQDVPSHEAFGCFFEHASGHNFSDVNVLYDRFLVAAGDRKMDEATTLSEELLSLYVAKRNPMVPHSMCEFMVRIFRACHFALQGDLSRAEREYVDAWHGEVPGDALRRGFERMAGDPEKILSHYFGD